MPAHPGYYAANQFGNFLLHTVGGSCESRYPSGGKVGFPILATYQKKDRCPQCCGQEMV